MRKQNIASDRRGPEAGDGFFHAVSLSGGKDSTCLLLLMIERGLPIDAVIWADTGMEFPEMYAHIAKVGEYLYQERGLHITVLRHPRGFEYFMLEVPQQKKAAIERRITMGQPLYGYGWPGVKVRWCTGQLKTHLITKEVNRLKGQHQLQQYVGIAADEAWRCKGLNYPLVDWGITEAQALQICYDRGFDFGGLYEIYHRASCWCCPLQRIGELRNLRHHHPELWARLLELDNRARAQFGPGPLGQFKQKQLLDEPLLWIRSFTMKEGEMKNTKQDRLKAELERAREKAAEWQAKVRDLEKQVREQENMEILREVRAIAASPEELRGLLDALRAAKEPPKPKDDKEVNGI